jgi:hypothetical protein
LSRLVLVEHAPARFRLEAGDTVVAMTPEACYELDGRGIHYRVTTDFGLDGRVAALEPLHWQEQLEWLESFDELVAAHVPATDRWGFGAATLYGFNLKTLVDPVRVRALELDCMLGSCSRVLLHRRAEVDPPVSWRLLFHGPSVTSRVLPLVARARGVDFEERIDEEAPPLETPTPVGIPQRRVGFLRRLKHRVRRDLRALLRVRSALTRPRTSRLTLLFADFGYDLTYLLARAREQGHRCLRVVDDNVVEEGSRRTEIARLPGDGSDAGWASAAEAVASPDHPLWDWPNGWLAGAPLADVIRPRILFWLSEVMPRVAARAAAFEGLLRSEGVDFVLGANLVKPDVPAAAAVTASPTQSVLVDHGDGAFVSELFDLIMLRHVDHNFCATSELAEYMESRGGLYDFPTAKLHVGSYRWRANASLARSGMPPQPVPEGRPVVVYALTATAGNGRYLNSPWYGDGWYYGLCREIVDVLARHPEVFSVVKLFPGDGNLRNPIDLYVEDLRLDHVVSSRAPLRAWIPWADRIVFDFPSTGLYETAAAGVPYLALLYTHHRHRPEAVERLAPAAVRFSEPAEAARAVEAFVTSPTVTAPRLYPEGEEILTTLERLAR